MPLLAKMVLRLTRAPWKLLRRYKEALRKLIQQVRMLLMTHLKAAYLPLLLLCMLFFCSLAIAEEEKEVVVDNSNTSQAYSDYEDQNLDDLNIRTPEATMITEGEQSFLRKVLWYLPNRVIDLIDIFKFDVGLGASAGLVLRVTRYGQMGGRIVNPLSVRIGLRGRELPFFFERESEYGFCSSFTQSESRHITPFELGLGADLGIGIYAGVSFDEIADFLLGFFLLDINHDDLVPMLEP